MSDEKTAVSASGGVRFTADQLRAVMARGRPVLVSAAAGSGKTRVLTERLMARVLEGEDIDRFLVITFTRAAAAELRGRILAELNRRAAADPADKRLRRQSALLYRAKIGTIDSFCTDIVRENAHLLEVSPAFSVLDEERSETMRARALEDVLDAAYERIGADAGLRALADSVGAGRDDSALAQIVLDVHRQMRSYAFPEKWMQEKLALLDVSGLTDAGQTVWGAGLLADAAQEAAYHAGRLEQALAVMARPENAKMQDKYGEPFGELARTLRAAAKAAERSWDETGDALARPFPSLKSLQRFEDQALKDAVKAVWDEAKAAVERLRKHLAGSSERLLAGVAASRAPMTALMELVRALDRAYDERKRRADGCDFADVEHLCVKLLCDDAGGPAPLAAALSDRFAEVMVDEYQDVNELQELLFRRVSHEGQTLFTVGDVKQAIYRFRLAEPSIFLARYDRFADGTQGERVLLRENFRSRKCVLDGCNAVFERIMSRQLGDVDYNDEARLVCGREDYAPEGEVPPELCVLEAAGSGEEDAPDKLLLEARYAAGRIRAMVASGQTVSDGMGGVRPIRYGDIALLLRAPNTPAGAAYTRALTEAGVPVNARQGGAFFSQPEVNFAVSMLAVADNPLQDVPLIAALRGLPFGFTPSDLAAVRAAGPGRLWDALCLRAEQDGRCRRFVELVRSLRSFAREESTDAVLRRLYDETGLLTICGVMADAPRRIADLMQLYEYARQFEAEGGRGLFRFVGWLRTLQEKGLEPPAPGREDAVQLMSIHKSKGLEFPVVFLCDNAHQWRRTGAGQVLCHRTLGLGMRLTDPERGVRWPTLPWRAIERQTAREELSEQERLLYVAMTRARERLVMTCVRKNARETVQALGGPSDGPIDPRSLLRASSPAAWLLAAAAADGGRCLRLRLVEPEEEQAPAQPAVRERPAADPALTDEIDRRLAWTYPYAGAVALPSKLTATAAREMAPGTADGEAADLPRPERTLSELRMPDFGRRDLPLTGPERGVAAHLVMQYIDFARTDSAEHVSAEIARLERMGLLDEKQAAAVLPEDILAFFRSALGRRVLAAERVIREFRFSLLCPASLWYPDADGEQVLLQGVVDCCIREGDALTVIDFKTDGHMEPERYGPQLRAYAMAMERIYKTPVKQAALWYLRLKKQADVPLDGTKT